MPRPRPPTLGDLLIHEGIAGSPGDATLLLAIAAVSLIGVSFYFLASAVEPPPSLGDDQARPGEHIPEYVHQKP